MKNYFKKFSFVFMMTLTIIGIGMVYSGSGANAATVGQQLTSPESGWTRIDDTDINIKYIGDWTTFSNPSRYKNTTHGTKQFGASLVFKFYGSKFRYICDDYVNYPKNVSVKIDDLPLEHFSEGNNSRGIYQCILYEKLNLANGIHKVEITMPDSGSWTIGMADAIDIDNNGYLLPSDKSKMNLIEGESQQISATTTPAGAQVTWKSSDTSVATVDLTGKVTGVKEGTCTITATTADGLTATCTVTVTKENKSISLNKSTTNLTLNNSETLIATTTPAGINVKWSSSDTSIATVDLNGKVTAIGAGTATITATTLDGSNLSASCLVTVVPKGNDPTPAGSEYITNIAHAKGDNTNNPGGEVTIIFHGTADTTLSVVKTADVKDVWVGDNFTYTLVITNTGTKTAKSVVVNDPAPNHIDFNVSGVTTTQGSVDSSSTSKKIIVNIGDIPPAGTVTIKVPATVIL